MPEWAQTLLLFGVSLLAAVWIWDEHKLGIDRRIRPPRRPLRPTRWAPFGVRRYGCWTCGGTGWVRGPLYDEPCPNEKCDAKEKADA